MKAQLKPVTKGKTVTKEFMIGNALTGHSFKEVTLTYADMEDLVRMRPKDLKAYIDRLYMRFQWQGT